MALPPPPPGFQLDTPQARPAPPVGYIPGVVAPKQPAAQTPVQAQMDAQQLRNAELEEQAKLLEIERKRATANDTDPKLKESENTASFLATRLAGSMKEIQNATSVDPSAVNTNVGRELVRGVSQYAAREMTPEQRQIVEDAQLNALDAALTLGTGAAYNREQLLGYAQSYFPQIGDKPATIAAKKERFRVLMEAAKIKAGSAAPLIDEALSRVGGIYGEEVNTTTPVVGDPDQGAPRLSKTTKMVTDEQLAAVAGPTGMLVTRGAPLARIETYLANKNINPAILANLREIIKQRDTPGSEVNLWIKQNPGKPYPIDPRYEAELSAADEIFNNVASGPVGAYGIAAGNVVTGNRLDNIVEATGGDADLANSLMGQVREENFKSSLAGDVTGGALMGLGLAGAGRSIGARLPSSISLRMGGTGALSPGAVAGDGALGAYIGSGEGKDLFSVEGALKGAAIGSGAGVAGRGVLNSAGRALAPTGGRLAPLYEGNPDFRPSLGQRVGGAYGRFEEVNNVIPLAGGLIRNNRNQAIDQAQRGAFNQALKEIGTELPSDVVKGTKAHAFMQSAFDDAYDKARSGMRLAIDATFGQEFGSILNDVDLLDAGSQNTFRQLATPVGKRLKARGGALDGDEYKMFSSRISKKVRDIRNNPRGDSELADALERFSMALDDTAKRHSPPEAGAALDAADRGYVRSVIIENASKGGGAAAEFTGAQLETAVKNGAGGLRSRIFLRGDAPMQEYAAAMRELGDTVPDSGTAGRLMGTAGVAAGGGAIGAGASPAVLAPSAATILTNAPGVRNVIGAVTSPNRRLRSPKARKVIIDRARLGGLFGVPLIEAQQQQ